MLEVGASVTVASERPLTRKGAVGCVMNQCCIQRVILYDSPATRCRHELNTDRDNIPAQDLESRDTAMVVGRTPKLARQLITCRHMSGRLVILQ